MSTRFNLNCSHARRSFNRSSRKEGEMCKVLALKHESRILGQRSNPVSGSRKSQASSPWAKQNRAQPFTSWIHHILGWMNVRESYSRALKQRNRRERSVEKGKIVAAFSANWAALNRNKFHLLRTFSARKV